MTLTAERLASEFVDLLKAGPAGIYELRWLANTLAGEPVAASDPILRDALSRVLDQEKGRLAWVRWPDFAILREEARAVADLPIEAWADPRQGEPLLAVLPAIHDGADS